MGKLAEGLKTAGYAPDQVTVVVLTHSTAIISAG